MVLPVISLFFLIALFSFFGRGDRLIQNNIFFLLLLTSMVLISTFRPENMPDYRNYLLFFRHSFEGDRFEFGFVFVTNIIKSWSKNPLYFFAVFAAISIFIKLWAIRAMSPFPWLSIIIYLSNIFILHDMIQMRCAVASGIMLWALKYVYEKNLVRFLVLSLIAFSFHYAALAIFPLWFIGTQKTHRKFYLLLIPISYALALSNIFLSSFLKIIQMDGIQHLWTMYQAKRELFVVVNIFNILQIIRCILCLFFWYYVNRIINKNHFFLLILKVYTISISAVVLFSDFPILAYRLSEFLLPVEMFLIPAICYVFKDKPLLARSGVIFIGLLLLLVNIYSTNLLK